MWGAVHTVSVIIEPKNSNYEEHRLAEFVAYLDVASAEPLPPFGASFMFRQARLCDLMIHKEMGHQPHAGLTAITPISKLAVPYDSL